MPTATVVATRQRARAGLADSAATKPSRASLPLGRRAPRGHLRWYLAEVREGSEQALCTKVRSIVPQDILVDAFVMQKEKWLKRSGAWFTTSRPAYRGCIFLATRDVIELDRALSHLTFPVRLIGSGERAWVPISEEMRAWYTSAMDARHVLRSSVAVEEDGAICVVSGPLAGQEQRIVYVNRHKRFCRVRVGDADGGFIEDMPLEIVRPDASFARGASLPRGTVQEVVPVH